MKENQHPKKKKKKTTIEAKNRNISLHNRKSTRKKPFGGTRKSFLEFSLSILVSIFLIHSFARSSPFLSMTMVFYLEVFVRKIFISCVCVGTCLLLCVVSLCVCSLNLLLPLHRRLSRYSSF